MRLVHARCIYFRFATHALFVGEKNSASWECAADCCIFHLFVSRALLGLLMWVLCFAQAEVVSVYLAARRGAAWRQAIIQKCESVKC